MSHLTCKRCGGHATKPIVSCILGSQAVYCDAPLHSAAQRVVDAAVALTRWYGETQVRDLHAAVAALLAAREEDANADA